MPFRKLDQPGPKEGYSFLCLLCKRVPKYFKTRYDVRRHLQDQHSGVAFQCKLCGYLYNRKNMSHGCNARESDMEYTIRETGEFGEEARQVLLNFINNKQEASWRYVEVGDEPESPIPPLMSVVHNMTEKGRNPRPRKKKDILSPESLGEPEPICLEEPPRKVPRIETITSSHCGILQDLACSPSLSSVSEASEIQQINNISEKDTNVERADKTANKTAQNETKTSTETKKKNESLKEKDSRKVNEKERHGDKDKHKVTETLMKISCKEIEKKKEKEKKRNETTDLRNSEKDFEKIKKKDHNKENEKRDKTVKIIETLKEKEREKCKPKDKENEKKEKTVQPREILKEKEGEKCEQKEKESEKYKQKDKENEKIDNTVQNRETLSEKDSEKCKRKEKDSEKCKQKGKESENGKQTEKGKTGYLKDTNTDNDKVDKLETRESVEKIRKEKKSCETESNKRGDNPDDNENVKKSKVNADSENTNKESESIKGKKTKESEKSNDRHSENKLTSNDKTDENRSAKQNNTAKNRDYVKTADSNNEMIKCDEISNSQKQKTKITLNEYKSRKQNESQEEKRNEDKSYTNADNNTFNLDQVMSDITNTFSMPLCLSPFRNPYDIVFEEDDETVLAVANIPGQSAEDVIENANNVVSEIAYKVIELDVMEKEIDEGYKIVRKEFTAERCENETSRKRKAEDIGNEEQSDIVIEVESEVQSEASNETEELRERQFRKESRKRRKMKERNERKELLKNMQEHKVILNVGGTRFLTCKDTLMTDPNSTFPLLFEEDPPLCPHGNNFFIDRDPAHFRLILNYLRNGCSFPNDTCLPRDPRYLLEIKAECEFYNLKGLRRMVKMRLERLSE